MKITRQLRLDALAADGTAHHDSTMPPTIPADPARINVQSTIEVNYWCNTFNCTETRLRNALHAAGPLVADVRAYLQPLRQLFPFFSVV